MASFPPLFHAIADRMHPAFSGGHNYARAMRLSVAVGVLFGTIGVYQRSSRESTAGSTNLSEYPRLPRSVEAALRNG